MGDQPVSGDFISDSPLANPEEDIFGYDEFSRNLADFIIHRVPDEKFVIGIYGEWGSGKSTVLEFTNYFLEQEEEQPIIVRFNPWWFSGQRDLLSQFFSELRASLGNEEDEEGKLQNIKEELKVFSDTLSQVPSAVTGGIPIHVIFAAVSSSMEQSDWGESEDIQSVSEAKETIVEELKDFDRQIVVLLDDIDRLAEDEMKQMFRLVKSVADFPNTTYVLAFDYNIVTGVLDDEQGENTGEEYMDKIVQLPQDIPKPRDGAIAEFIDRNLQPIIQSEETVINQSRWQAVYSESILEVIETPREAVRLCNSVNSMHAKIGGEVNFADIVLVEALRIFYRPVYEEIDKNPEKYVLQRGTIETDDNPLSFLDNGIDDQKKEQIRGILGYLFPQIGSSASQYHAGDLSKYKRNKRVCAPTIFHYYFRQTIPEGEVTITEAKSLLTAIDNPTTFADKLVEMTEEQGRQGKTRANGFLHSANDLVDEVDNPRVLIESLFICGDQLIQSDPSYSLFDGGSQNPLFRIITKLLQEENREDRSEILQNAIENGHSLYLPYHLIGAMMQEHGEYGGEKREESERTLTSEQIQYFRIQQ